MRALNLATLCALKTESQRLKLNLNVLHFYSLLSLNSTLFNLHLLGFILYRLSSFGHFNWYAIEKEFNFLKLKTSQDIHWLNEGNDDGLEFWEGRDFLVAPCGQVKNSKQV